MKPFLPREELSTKGTFSIKVHHHHHLFAFMWITDFKKAYSRLLGEETSGNHQAYRRGHLEITILNKNKGCEGVRQELTQKTILIKTLALCS